MNKQLRDRLNQIEKQMQPNLLVVIAEDAAIEANPDRFRDYMDRIEQRARRERMNVIVLTDETPLAVNPRGRLVYDFSADHENEHVGGQERLLHFTAWLRSGQDGYTPPDA